MVRSSSRAGHEELSLHRLVSVEDQTAERTDDSEPDVAVFGVLGPPLPGKPFRELRDEIQHLVQFKRELPTRLGPCSPK